MTKKNTKLLYRKQDSILNFSTVDQNGDLIINTSDIFPFIFIQSGIANDLQIGQINPNTGNFTTLTSTTFSTFDNYIRLGGDNEPEHGILYNNDRFFIGSVNNTFTFRDNQLNELLSANFSRINIGENGINQSSVSTNTNGDLILQPGINANVILPIDTHAYRPRVNHNIVTVSNSSNVYSVNLDNNFNIEYIQINGSTNVPGTQVNLVLPNASYSGFIKTIFVEDIPLNVSVKCLLLIRQFASNGTVQNRTLEFVEKGSSIQLIYDTVHTCWCFLDTGVCVS